jgi:hypothetical protein
VKWEWVSFEWASTRSATNGADALELTAKQIAGAELSVQTARGPEAA